MYFNNSDLGRQGVTQSVREYCLNESKCRKHFINSYFGFDDAESACSKCDVCNAQLKCTWEFEQPLTIDKRGIVRYAISLYVQTTGLDTTVSEIQIEKLVFNAEFYRKPSYIMRDLSLDESTAAALSSVIRQCIDRC
jgi:hypothetical protein